MEQGKTIKRHKAITNLIGAKAITDQQSLLELLDKEYDIQASQAVVSRDLRALGVVKKAINGSLQYENVNDPSKDLLRKVVISVQRNEAIIVITTLAGCAAFVGDYIDASKNLDILGTLAGENVVFVTPLSIYEIERVYLSIKKLTYSL